MNSSARAEDKLLSLRADRGLSLDVAINTWFWSQPATGSGQYIRHLLPALTKLDPSFQPHLVNPKSQAADGLQDDIYKLWFEQVTFPRRSVQRGAGVAHVPYFASPVRPTTPTVVTIHDLIPMVLPAYRGSVLVRAYTRLVAAGARRADAIVADSEWSKRDVVAHLDVEPERVRVIPLAVSSRFQPATPEDIARVRSHYGLPDRYALYLGGFDQRKNVPALLRAFAGMQREPDLRLVVAGRLPKHDTNFTPDPRRITAELDIEDVVVFPGWIAEESKPALYSGAELFVYPSLYEGFGLPVLEAMACSTPVVTSNVSSLPEIVGGAGLAVDPTNIEALTQALQAVLRDEERRQSMREASLKQAARFSWEWTAQATLEVYRNVAR